MIYRYCITLIFLISLTSCVASIFGNKRQDVEFNSEPAGAKVYLNGKYIGDTPVKYNIGVTNGQSITDGGEKGIHHITYFKDNFYKEEFNISRTSGGEGASLIDNYGLCFADSTITILTLGLIPSALVDLINGSCDGFQKIHFKVLEEKKINTETKIVK